MSPEKKRAIVFLFLIGIILIQCYVIWFLWDLTGEMQENIDKLEAMVSYEQWRNYLDDAIVIVPAQTVCAGGGRGVSTRY